jgi:hypothetical protein
MLQLMIDTALFSGIDEKIIREISLFSEVVIFFEGEQAIVEEKAGQHPDMLLLVDGKVNVESKFSPLPTAKKFNLPGISNEMFGEVGWILGNKRSASVSCLTTCKFIRIHGGKLFEYCQSNPAVGFELMTRIASVLAQRVVNLSTQMKNKELFS